MSDQIKINLSMAGANYPLTIDRDEEEIMRNAAKQVDLRLNAYLQYYRESEIPRERIIVMAAYQFALELLKERQRNDTEPFVAKIKELTDLLDEHLNEQGAEPEDGNEIKRNNGFAH